MKGSMNMCAAIMNNEQRFRDWLRRQLNDVGVRRYTDNAIIAYAHCLRVSCMEITPFVAGNLFTCNDIREFEPLMEKIQAADNFEAVNEDSGNGTFLSALKLYRHFLKYGPHSKAPEISSAFYLRNKNTEETYNEDRGLKYRYAEVEMVPIQRIYYGAPGSGKSYTVSKLIEEIYPDPVVFDAHCRRLIFHPAYTYEDFVGGIKPLSNPDRPIDNVFVPGPLAVLLKEAFSNPKEPYYLIIEEINRGNAPAILGDLFQLLDRQPNGKSRYAVQNPELVTYLAKDPGLKNIFAEGKVWFPANFNILATMNTADENIFVLDSAFKRRFNLEYVRIDFDKLPEAWTHAYDTFAGNRPLTSLFQGTPLAEYVAELYYEGKLARDWPTFGRLVNKLIDIMNKEVRASENPHLARIAENKKLGPFFVSEADLCQRDTFVNKVIFYLKQDVFTFSDHYMTESYEEIYMKYIEEDADLFELLL